MLCVSTILKKKSKLNFTKVSGYRDAGSKMPTVKPFQFETSAESESVDPIPLRHLSAHSRGAEMEWCCGEVKKRWMTRIKTSQVE